MTGCTGASWSTEGHSGGVVASGAAVTCGATVPTCALGDGSLTRAPIAAGGPVMPGAGPSTPLNVVDGGTSGGVLDVEFAVDKAQANHHLTEPGRLVAGEAEMGHASRLESC